MDMDTQHPAYKPQDLLGVVNGQPVLRYTATGDRLVAANDQHVDDTAQTSSASTAASLAATSGETL